VKTEVEEEYVSMRANRWINGIAGAILLAGWGCSEGGGSVPAVSSSNDPAKVSGKVTVNGKAVDNAEVIFSPMNVNRKSAVPVSAKTGADGTFNLTTLVGDNTVTIHSPAIDKDPKLNMNGKQVVVKDGDVIPIDLP
jgi:hypothetical protein